VVEWPAGAPGREEAFAAAAERMNEFRRAMRYIQARRV
jgi:hypothetical protein